MQKIMALVKIIKGYDSNMSETLLRRMMKVRWEEEHAKEKRKQQQRKRRKKT